MVCLYEIVVSIVQFVVVFKVGSGLDFLGRRKFWLGLRYLDQGLVLRIDDLFRVQVGWVLNLNFGF